MTRRIRLAFTSDIVGLALPRSSLILLPKLNSVGDVSDYIRRRYFGHVPDVGVRLELSGFTIDVEEDGHIIRDEDQLTVVVVAAQLAELQKPSEKSAGPHRLKENDVQLDERSLRKIEKHRVRREKQRESRKQAKKIKHHANSITKLRPPSGGVVLTTDTSNSENVAAKDSPESPEHNDIVNSEPGSIQKSVQKSATAQPSGATLRQGSNFSRVSLNSDFSKILPKGHFRFGDGSIDAVPAQQKAPLCTVKDGKSVERAKRLGSFFFKSSPPLQPEALNVQQLPESSLNVAETANLSYPKAAPNNVAEVCPSRPGVNLDPSGCVSAERSASTDYESNHGACNDRQTDDDTDHDVLLKTIAVRGENFFAPRTLDRFGLKREYELQSEDDGFQRRCESLTSVTDPKTLKTGSEIAFRRLEIVNWTPQMSKFVKYRFLELSETGDDVSVVTDDDREEVHKLLEMHDIKLLDAVDDEIPVASNTAMSVDSEIAAALQSKRLSMLAGSRH